MVFAGRIMIGFLVFLLVFLVGGIFLQIFLSKRESRWPGLVLPALCVLVGLLYTFSATTLPGAAIGFLIGGGIPCLVHLAIYGAGRGRVRRRRQDQVEKMNIQDL